MRRFFFLSAIAGPLVLGCGCQPGKEYQDWLTQGQQACSEQRYDQAVQQLTQYINAVGTSPEAARAYYLRGVALAELKQGAQARQDLQRAAQFPGQPDVCWRACSVLGTLDYEDGRWPEATRHYEAVAQIAPQEPPKDLFLFRLGACYERTGRWENARRTFRRIVDEFPQSSVASDALRRVQLGADHFSVQCGVFSSLTNAENLVRQLEQDGFAPTVQREPRNGVMVYVVQVGRFNKYEYALQELARVKGYIPTAVLWP
jgi:tetratricopeptide (TPR) repeat protein